MLAKTNRLAKKKDFDSVFKKGQSFKEDLLILSFAESKMENNRFGIVVSQKISKKAVIRNKVKRRIRNIIKLLLPEIKKKVDVVLLALPGLETKNSDEMKVMVKKLFKKAKLIDNV